MVQRLGSWWFSLQQGLWFIPSLMTFAASVLALVMIRLDQGVLAEKDIRSWWFFEGGAEGARGVLTAIAGTMMTVATTVFSITIVALQLASSQFSPRVLRGFTRDRGNQLVLGIFIATFVYALLVLRSVHSETSDLQVFVPAASVTLALVLAIIAIGSLIFFFHHATRTMQASVVIDRAANDTLASIAAHHDRIASNHVTVVQTPLNRENHTTISADRSGYITGVDVESLVEVANDYQTVISVDADIGTHVLSSSTLATVPAIDLASHPEYDEEQLERRIRRAFTIEMERTLEHDMLLGFRQLSDVAIRALSPGINDPTTAVTCIDRLGEALLQSREFRREVTLRAASHGRAGVIRTSVGFDDIVAECFPQIRHYAAGDAIVVGHTLKVLEQVARDASPAASALLAEQARLLVEEAMTTLHVESDLQHVHIAGAWATMEPLRR